MILVYTKRMLEILYYFAFFYIYRDFIRMKSGMKNGLTHLHASDHGVDMNLNQSVFAMR